MENISVCSYSSYRAFLLAHAQGQKEQNRRWTYGSWAKKLGLKSTSSITKIVKGERHPGPDITDRLVRYFRFAPKEESYFHDLVSLQKVQNDPRFAVLLMEKMGKEHPDGKIRLLDDKEFFVISHWYVLAIREMVRMNEFCEEPSWIAKRFLPKLTAREVKEAIAALEQTGLVKRDRQGKLAVSEGRVHSGNEVASEGIKRYHTQMLDNAKSALRQVPVDQREMTASTLVISSEKLPEAKQLIREFKSKFARLLEDVSGDRVYQMQIQLFPLTKSNHKETP